MVRGDIHVSGLRKDMDTILNFEDCLIHNVETFNTRLFIPRRNFLVSAVSPRHLKLLF